MAISSSSDSSFILSSSSFSSSGGAEFCIFCLKRKEMREKDFLVEALKSFLLFAFFAWYLVPRIPFFLLSSPLSSLLLHSRYLQSKKCFGVSTLFSLRSFRMNMFQLCWYAMKVSSFSCISLILLISSNILATIFYLTICGASSKALSKIAVLPLIFLHLFFYFNYGF